MVGEAGITLALVASLGSMAAFMLYAWGRDKFRRPAYILFYGQFLAVVVASCYLLYALIDHRFEYYYVFAYTDRGLDLSLRISAFWAGVEGTFLLWALLGGLVGIFILKYEQKHQATVMTVLSFIQAALLVFLVVMSPFRVMVDMPADGAGLNPLLKNPWMVVHPPVVFAGYALMLIPFALAISALGKKDYFSWAKRALPWSHLGLLLLGMGIFFGGYWAYRVLGWGGYWSWDPVENASLVPWLTGVALIHGLLVLKGRKIWLRSNLLLAIITYVLVFYATFLTRSGVLADFSVHSFIESPLNPYMGGVIAVIMVLGLGLFFYRNHQIAAGENTLSLPPGSISRETVLAYGIMLLVASAALISLGTSAPLITSWLGSPSDVGESFYLTTNAPLAIAMAFLLGLIPFVGGKPLPVKTVLRRALPYLAAGAAAGGLISWWLGASSPVSILYLMVSFFALLANFLALYLNFRREGWKAIGAPLAHLGTTLVLIGFIASYVYPQEEMVTLPRGDPQEVLGYSVTYQERATGTTEETFQVKVEEGASSFILEPRHYVAGREEQLMRDPDLVRYWWGDLFLSTQEFQYQREGSELTLKKDGTVSHRDYYITLQELQMEQQSPEEVRVEAMIELRGGELDGETEVSPALIRRGEDFLQEPDYSPQQEVQIYLEEVDPEGGGVQIHFAAGEEVAEERLVAELSKRPFIIYLALGTVLIMAGFTVAAWRRLKI